MAWQVPYSHRVQGGETARQQETKAEEKEGLEAGVKKWEQLSEGLEAELLLVYLWMRLHVSYRSLSAPAISKDTRFTRFSLASSHELTEFLHPQRCQTSFTLPPLLLSSPLDKLNVAPWRSSFFFFFFLLLTPRPPPSKVPYIHMTWELGIFISNFVVLSRISDVGAATDLFSWVFSFNHFTWLSGGSLDRRWALTSNAVCAFRRRTRWWKKLLDNSAFHMKAKKKKKNFKGQCTAFPGATNNPQPRAVWLRLSRETIISSCFMERYDAIYNRLKQQSAVRHSVLFFFLQDRFKDNVWTNTHYKLNKKSFIKPEALLTVGPKIKHWQLKVTVMITPPPPPPHFLFSLKIRLVSSCETKPIDWLQYGCITEIIILLCENTLL